MNLCDTCNDIEVERECGEITCYLCREELEALMADARIEFGA